MSANREQQRERLIERRLSQLIESTPPFSNVAMHLVANGVTVSLPPEPDIAPGTTGWATVGTDETVRWLKNWDGYQYVGERTQGWSREGSPMLRDFVPDPEPLTAEAVEALASELLDPDDPRESWTIMRDALAPYVAKGGTSDE